MGRSDVVVREFFGLCVGWAGCSKGLTGVGGDV